MKLKNKKECRKEREDWQKALDERRVLSFNNGLSKASYPSIEARNAALSEMKFDLTAHVVCASCGSTGEQKNMAMCFDCRQALRTDRAA